MRVTYDEHQELAERAHAARRSLSRYLIESGLRGRPPKLQSALPPSPEERAILEGLFFQLRKAGVNLNQLAHRENSAAYTDAEPPTDAELREASKAVSELVREIEKRL